MMPFGLMLSLEAIELLQICHLIMDPRIKSEGDVRDWDGSGDKSSVTKLSHLHQTSGHRPIDVRDLPQRLRLPPSI